MPTEARQSHAPMVHKDQSDARQAILASLPGGLACVRSILTAATFSQDHLKSEVDLGLPTDVRVRPTPPFLSLKYVSVPPPPSLRSFVHALQANWRRLAPGAH